MKRDYIPNRQYILADQVRPVTKGDDITKRNKELNHRRKQCIRFSYFIIFTQHTLCLFAERVHVIFLFDICANHADAINDF